MMFHQLFYNAADKYHIVPSSNVPQWKMIIHLLPLSLPKNPKYFLQEYSERTISSTKKNYTSKESPEAQLFGARST